MSAHPSPGDPTGRSVVVLGSTGFIGGHLRDAFVAAGARVVGVARTGADVALDLTVASPADIAGVLTDARADVVVNATGMVWSAGVDLMRAVNGDAVERVVAAIAGIRRAPRLIQLGSAYEYGDVPFGSVVSEARTAVPDTDYGRTKLDGTEAVVRAARQRGVDGVVFRLAVVSGPGAPSGSLLGVVARHLVRAAAGGERPADLSLAPLRAHRDLVDVRDVADAVLAAATSRADLRGEVINIGSGAAVPVRRVVDLMISLTGLPVRVAFTEGHGGSVRSDADWLSLDIGKAARLLGWLPRRPLEASLRDLVVDCFARARVPVPALTTADGHRSSTREPHPRQENPCPPTKAPSCASRSSGSPTGPNSPRCSTGT